jgi:adenylate cyclase
MAADLEAKPAGNCRMCGAALGGPLSYVSLVLGVRRSQRNPNLCNRCAAHMKEGEVVEITALFADLAGFTRLTQTLGPERTSAIVDGFLRATSHAVHRHDGVVDKYIGDAVMALFNAPIRREDHTRRAVAAALDIVDQMKELSSRYGEALDVRVGIASGNARLGRVGSDDASSFTALGDPVNLASRLEAVADPGQIVVDAGVLAAVASAFPGATTRSVELKGFAAREVAILGASPAAALALRSGPTEHDRSRSVSRGAAVLAALAAPCAGFYLFSPVVYALGFGAVFQSAAVLAVDQFFDGPARLVLSVAGVACAAVVLGFIVRARARRSKLGQIANYGERMQERRLLIVASIALMLVAFEHWVHLGPYHKSLFAAQ